MAKPALGTVSIALNMPDALPPLRTYVTFGLERGGTSAVAGVERALGLDLGDIPQGNNEDPRFHNKTLAEMRATIKERNQECDVWGFKYPSAVTYLPTLVNNLRNPFFVSVYRDTVATALSRARWDGDFIRRPIRMALHEANGNSNLNLTFALSTGRPTLLISNERAERHQSELIDEVAEFLGVDRPDDQLRERILAYIQPGSYKKFADFFPGDEENEDVQIEEVSGGTA